MKKTNGLVRFDLGKLQTQLNQAGKMVIQKDSEEELVKVMEFFKKVDNFKEELKKTLLENGNTIMPNFRGAEGDKVRIQVREYGHRYETDNILEIDEQFLISSPHIDSRKVDKYVKDKNELPKGIHKVKRERRLTISLKGGEES
jgi:hypothetical protein